jgi:uncharacterized protein (TIGR02611 family)
MAADMDADESPRSALAERLRGQRERHLRRPFIVRAAFVVAGFTLLVAGLAMLVLPGPALAIIPIALAILSLEFAWAEQALERALDHAQRAKRTARSTSRTQRILIGIASACAAGAAIAAVLLWDIPYLPV